MFEQFGLITLFIDTYDPFRTYQNNPLTLFGSLTPILISRFLMNLRQIDSSRHRSTGHLSASNVLDLCSSEAVHTSVIGNLGEPLEYEFVDEEEVATSENELVGL